MASTDNTQRESNASAHSQSQSSDSQRSDSHQSESNTQQSTSSASSTRGESNTGTRAAGSQTATAQTSDRHSAVSLLIDVGRDIAALVRGELELAKAEMSEKTSQVTTGAVSIVVAGAVAYAGFLVLLGAAVLGLMHVLPAWLSALIVGAVVLIIGAILLLIGRSKLRAVNLQPNRTLTSLRNTQQFAQRHEHNIRKQVS